MTLFGIGCIEDEQEGLDYLKKGFESGDGRCAGECLNYYSNCEK